MANVYPFDRNGNYRTPAPEQESGADITVLAEGVGAVPAFDEQTGTTQFELNDGNVVVAFGPPVPEERESNFEDNLADYLSLQEQSQIAEKLLQGIELDNQSRSAWLENMSAGISLLGLEVKNPRGATAAAATPAEGTSTVDSPLLLEAVLRFQANARGELLPADGPVKVRNDGAGTGLSEDLAEALEKDLNHYLTKVAKEYYPDTDRMLLMLGFSGISFKKGYHDPIKQRPVIASIDAKDLIVSDAATNIDGAGRVTHRIMMRPSHLRRMQLVGAYSNVELQAPDINPIPNPVDAKIDAIQGIAPPTYIEPEDQDREIYECYCEIEVPGFEHKLDGEPTGLPLPYKVTIDRSARKILEIRRNWHEDDAFCLPRNRIIAYTFIPGLGFYGIGLLNVLGNATKAVTAAWRLLIDAGMYSNFPGFLYLKTLAKQLTNQFRIPPGGGMAIDAVGNDIRASVMALPYQPPNAVFIQLMQTISEAAQRVGGTAELQVGEGRQDAPVGTTLAMVEQATKLMSAVHKRLHQAQGQEFDMLRSLLMEDPEALWRHNKKSKVLEWLIQQSGLSPASEAMEQAEEQHRRMFLLALSNCELVPAADPNTSSQTERYMKVMAMRQMADTNPAIDKNKVDERIFKIMGVDDAEALFVPPPPQGSQPPSPEMMAAQATLMAAQARLKDAETRVAEVQANAQIKAADNAAKMRQIELTGENKREEMASRERIASLQVAEALVIHSDDKGNEAAPPIEDVAGQRAHEKELAQLGHEAKLRQAEADRLHDLVRQGLELSHKSRESALDRTYKGFEIGQRQRDGEASHQRQLQQRGVELSHEAIQSDLERQHRADMAERAAKAKTKPSSSKPKPRKGD